MKKRVLLLVLMLIMLVAAAACAENSSTGDNEQGNTDSSFILTDMEGREVHVEGDIERVLAIGSALRLYTYIAGTEMLVGVEKSQQNAETGRPYIMANLALAELPIIGEGFPANPNPELLLQVDADVIIAGDIMDKAALEELQATIGVPVVIITCGNNAVFDESAYEAMRIIGKITGKEQRAEEVVTYMESCKAELTALTKDISETAKPTVYVGGLSHKGTHGIESTAVQSPLLTAINAANVADSLSSPGSVMIDKEKLLEWDPDVLILDENGLSIVQEDYRKNPAFYNTLSAVKNGKVYGQLPYVSYYSNIETAIADIYYVGKVLYPEQFQEIDPIKKADEIYNFLFGQPLYAKMAELYGGFQPINLQASL